MIGRTISHYHILEELGRGGMGVVYKAEDTKLKRTVALKFLPANAVGSQEDKARFVREAQAAAALNHPNIATVYGIDEHEGDMFIAMEYIEGQTLREKIQSGPLKLKEVIKIASQAAQGLHAAHEKGVIHRDIKSANIMITDKGLVKIMDFGLAKVAAGSMVTRPNTTLGTIAYMSPEQSRGEKVDHRTDIWSLGVVLYEMISGLLPFRGEYETAIVYSIQNVDPEQLTGIRTGVPMEIERIVNKLLAKDPDDRYQNINELPVDLKAIDLSSSSESSSLSTSVTKVRDSKSNSLWRWAAIVCFVLFLISFVINTMWRPKSTEKLSVKRSFINLPESAPIAPIGSAPLSIGRPALALSPDGTNLVYVADVGGNTQLYLRPMNQFEAKPISGTEGAYNPFFSPDGQWIGFFAGSVMKKVSIHGGTPVSICEAVNSYGASWGPHDRIIFSPNEGSVISWISAVGGTPQVITEGGLRYTWPEILPGGKAVLVSGSGSSGIRVISFNSGKEKKLIVNGENPKYLLIGYLVYTQSGRLQAVPFNLDKLEVTGAPVPVLDNVRTEATWGATQYTISNDGTLIYLPGISEAKSKLVWLDREGSVEQLQFPVETYGTFQLSPDGQRLAIQVQNAKWNIWVYNLVRGSRSKLTLEGNNKSPIWTSNGKWVTFTSDRTGPYNLFMKSADGSGEIKQLIKSERIQHPYSWSPDGKLLAFTESTQAWDILLISINNKAKSQPFADTRFSEWGPSFSHDGQWIAYVSDEQGRYDVYVQPYPQTGERWRVSTEGGEEPVWSPKSNELFYRNGKKWMAVSYSTAKNFKPDMPEVLFEGNYVNVGGRSYDVSPDGQRFLLLKSSEESIAQSRLNVVANWFGELKSKFEAGS